MGFLLLFLFLIFGCCCGDLKRMDFWDWLFGRGFDVEFRACFKKASFMVGLNGARRARWGLVRALEKNPFSKRIGFGPQVGFGYAKTRPELDPLPFLVLKAGKY